MYSNKLNCFLHTYGTVHSVVTLPCQVRWENHCKFKFTWLCWC